MSNVGFIVSLHSEVPFLFRDTSVIHQLNDNLIKVVISGIGQKRAGRKTKSLCESKEGFTPEYLINLGYCGATNDELKIGDPIIASRLSYNNQEIQLENGYINKVKNALQDTKYFEGKLQTFDRPVFSKSRICGDTLAVDMESFAIGETCMKFQIPVIILKIVSDIVPEKVSIKNLWYQLKNIIAYKRHVQNQINEFVEHYFYESGNAAIKTDKS